MNTNKKLVILFSLGGLIILSIISVIIFTYITGKGAVVINTTLSGNIPFNVEATLNEKKIITPYSAKDLEPGKYTLTIDRTDVKNKTQEIEVKKFQTSTYNIVLQPVDEQEIIDETESQ